MRYYLIEDFSDQTILSGFDNNQVMGITMVIFNPMYNPTHRLNIEKARCQDWRKPSQSALYEIISQVICHIPAEASSHLSSSSNLLQAQPIINRDMKIANVTSKMSCNNPQHSAWPPRWRYPEHPITGLTTSPRALSLAPLTSLLVLIH